SERQSRPKRKPPRPEKGSKTPVGLAVACSPLALRAKQAYRMASHRPGPEKKSDLWPSDRALPSHRKSPRAGVRRSAPGTSGNSPHEPVPGGVRNRILVAQEPDCPSRGTSCVQEGCRVPEGVLAGRGIRRAGSRNRTQIGHGRARPDKEKGPHR